MPMPTSTRSQDPARAIYNLLKFQYTPIEQRMKREAPTLYAQFLTFPYARRIAIMDKLASAQGL